MYGFPHPSDVCWALDTDDGSEMRYILVLPLAILAGCAYNTQQSPAIYSNAGNLEKPTTYCDSGPNGQSGACAVAAAQAALVRAIAK
jgi:hypothetical protein